MEHDFKIGDTIRCHDPKELVKVMTELEEAGIQTDFLYEQNGEKGYWLEVIGMEGKGLDLDVFNESINGLITDNECKMLITMPEGTQKPKIESNMNLGPVVHFYFLLAAMNHTMKDILNVFSKDEMDYDGFIDGMLDMVREALKSAEDEE